MTAYAKLDSYSQRRSVVGIRHAMESLWIIAAVLVPLAIAPTDWMQFYAQLPQIAVLRSIVGLISVLWLFELLLNDERALNYFRGVKWSGWSEFGTWLAERPTRLIIVTVSAFMV